MILPVEGAIAPANTPYQITNNKIILIFTIGNQAEWWDCNTISERVRHQLFILREGLVNRLYHFGVLIAGWFALGLVMATKNLTYSHQT